MKKVNFLFLVTAILMLSSLMLSSFESTADDPTTVTGARNILATYRNSYTPNAKGRKPGCFAYLHGTIKGSIGGKQINEILSSTDIQASGICEVDDVTTISTFAFTDVAKTDPVTKQPTGTPWARCSDSEYKLLKKLANKIGLVKGTKYSNIEGSISMACEHKFCASCIGVIAQFKAMFPVATNPKFTFIGMESVKDATSDESTEK